MTIQITTTPVVVRAMNGEKGVMSSPKVLTPAELSSADLSSSEPEPEAVDKGAIPKALAYSTYCTITLIVFANFAQFITNCFTLGAGVKLSNLLGKNYGAGEANWIMAAFPLTNSAFVLVSGRLGAIYGHQNLVIVGTAMLAVFSLANGFCKTYESFVALRALTGISGGLVTPNAVAVVTTLIPPGRTRNIIMGVFGATLPMGGWFGLMLSAIFVEHVSWQWMFFFQAIFAAAILASLLLFRQKEIPVDKDGKIDYVGAFLGLGSLLLFSFSWNQSTSAGWSNASSIAPLAVSIPMFFVFLLWESRFAKEPIMPLHIFKAPTFLALICVVLLAYMSFSASLWYTVAWQELVRGWSILHFAVGWIPFLICSTAAIFLAAWLVPRLPAQWILALGILSVIASNLLVATMPIEQTYWAQVFPSIILSGLCPDFVYVAAQLIASNNVNRREQGIAGSLVGTLNLYGNTLGLGFAGTVETQIAKNDDSTEGTIRGYRAALYFCAALAVLSLILDFIFVRVPKDEREGWQCEEDLQAMRALEQAAAAEKSRV